MDVNGFLTELKNIKTNDCLILIDLLLYFYFCAEDCFAVNLKTQFTQPSSENTYSWSSTHTRSLVPQDLCYMFFSAYFLEPDPPS